MPWSNSKSADRLSILAGAWFALALLGLLVLGLLLAGILRTPAWRDWLEANWSLTFPTPLAPWQWQLFGLAALGIVLLYFLKLKRRALQVPSTFLWRKSIEDLHVNSLFQWLRRNFLLILQLLFLLGLGYALAGPTHNSESKGRHLILMIDNSASMSATDVPPSRLANAKQEARRRIEALDPSDQAMVIAFNSEAQILQSYTNRQDELLRAVERIEPSHRPTQLEQALALAEGQANPRRSAEDVSLPRPAEGEGMARTTVPPEGIATDVYLYSDGRFADVADFNLGKLHLRLQPVGHSTDNVGIVKADVRRDEERPDELEVAVRVLNYRDTRVEKRLALQLEIYPGAPQPNRQVKPVNLSARTVQELPPSSDRRKKRDETPGTSLPDPLVTFRFKDPGFGYLRLSLRDLAARGPWKDDFALDDVAWLAIAPVRRARVLRIGPANDILDAFLRAVESQRRATLTSLSPTGFENHARYQEAIQAEAFDLVLFDRCAPASLAAMPQANTFFIGAVPPLRPGLEWSGLPPMNGLFVREFQTTHPLLRGIETLQGMYIDEARALPRKELPSRASALLETQEEPVLWTLGRDRFTDLVMLFPLVVEDRATKQLTWNTNWPKQPAGTLPLFFDNIVTQLGRYKEREEPHRPGVPKLLDPGVPIPEVEVTRSDPPGAPVKVRRESGKEFVFGSTEHVGLYDVSWSGGVQYRFAVNLFDSQESNIQPREDFQVGDEAVAKTEEALRQRWELWPWLTGVALGILLLEWYLYTRRIYV